MGNIITTKRTEQQGKYIVEILVEEEEIRQLRGEMNGVCVFSDSIARTPSRISLRGRNEATKYFLIPTKLRKRLAVHGSVGCIRMDHLGKTFFIYVVDPTGQNRSAYLSE